MEQLAPRVFVGEFAGASTTLASIGDDPARRWRCSGELMTDLGLGVPVIGWHAARDRFAELGCVLAMIAATMGKIAREVVLLQKSEVMELEEPHRQYGRLHGLILSRGGNTAAGEVHGAPGRE